MGSSATLRSTASAAAKIPSEVRLFHWPLVQDGWRSAAGVLGTLLVTGLAYWLSGSLPMTALTGLALVLSTWRFWFPVSFQLTAEGISQFSFGRRRLIPWLWIARYDVQQRGILLHFDREPSPFAWLSTFFLRWGSDRERVLEMVEFFTRRGQNGTVRGSSRTQRSVLR